MLALLPSLDGEFLLDVFPTSELFIGLFAKGEGSVLVGEGNPHSPELADCVVLLGIVSDDGIDLLLSDAPSFVLPEGFYNLRLPLFIHLWYTPVVCFCFTDSSLPSEGTVAFYAVMARRAS